MIHVRRTWTCGQVGSPKSKASKGGTVTGGTVDYDTGIAIVYNSSDQELFRIKHEAYWNEAGAISGTAKDIVSRVHMWRTQHPK
jgi:hypothetical protein